MTQKAQISEDCFIPMPLTASMKRIAQQFAREQPTPPRAQQVYLNTLAVSAVNNYLHILGVSTDLNASGSWNPSVRLGADVADLWLTGLGSIECRPVEPGALTCQIPPEVSFDRIGYIIVQIDQESEQANLVGFSEIPPTEGESLVFSQLRSLQELPTYLHQCRPVANLSQWFQGVFETGWQSVESLFDQDQTLLAFGFRDQPLGVVKRCKRIELGDNCETVILIAAITPDSDLKMHLMVKVSPIQGKTYLPPNLHLSLLDEQGGILRESKARDKNQTIQFMFRGEPGDHFSIEIALEDSSIIEDFVV
ncbi:MAG: DUF1822 family protein [Leptolyngbyaceae cyanobacterium MO_188.B28]|nr:DUF1822 family protein [Leptolyngbyaceae cyanobacterium MO_188.B28]